MIIGCKTPRIKITRGVSFTLLVLRVSLIGWLLVDKSINSVSGG